MKLHIVESTNGNTTHTVWDGTPQGATIRCYVQRAKSYKAAVATLKKEGKKV